MSLSRAARLALKLAKRKKYTWRDQFKSQKTTPRVKGTKTEAKYNFKQKHSLLESGKVSHEYFFGKKKNGKAKE